MLLRKKPAGEMTIGCYCSRQQNPFGPDDEKWGLSTRVLCGRRRQQGPTFAGRAYWKLDLSAKFISQAQEQDLKRIGHHATGASWNISGCPHFCGAGRDYNPAIRMLVGTKGAFPDSVVDVLVEISKQGYDGQFRDRFLGIDGGTRAADRTELDAF